MDVWREEADHLKQVAFFEKNKCKWRDNLRIQHVTYTTVTKKAMLSYLKMIVENHWIMIHPRFTKILTALHTSIDREGILEKDQISFNDTLDSLKQNVTFYGDYVWP